MPSFPCAPFSASSTFLRSAPDGFLLTNRNTSCTIEMPASLRSDGARVHPGMPFGFPPQSEFGFAGILTRRPDARWNRIPASAANGNQFSILSPYDDRLRSNFQGRASSGNGAPTGWDELLMNIPKAICLKHSGWHRAEHGVDYSEEPTTLVSSLWRRWGTASC